MATDRDRALMEAHCIRASDEYFAARPALTGGRVHRAIYESAYARAWRDLAALAAPPVEQQALSAPDSERAARAKAMTAAQIARLLREEALCVSRMNVWQMDRAAELLEAQPAPQAGVADRWVEVNGVRVHMTKEQMHQRLRQQPSQDAEDAARWREALRHVGAADHLAGQHFTLWRLAPVAYVNLLRGGVAEHFTRAIDAARSAAPPQGETR